MRTGEGIRAQFVFLQPWNVSSAGFFLCCRSSLRLLSPAFVSSSMSELHRVNSGSALKHSAAGMSICVATVFKALLLTLLIKQFEFHPVSMRSCVCVVIVRALQDKAIAE